MKKVLVLLVALSFLTTLRTEEYVFRNGYYYLGTVPYLRYKSWWQEYVRYPTYHYEWRWRWEYEPVVIETKTIQLPPVSDRNWRVAAFEALAAREENDVYLKTFALLNGTSFASTSQAQISGDTSYRSYKADLYGSSAELALMYGQQSALNTNNAIEFAKLANGQFNQLNANQLKVLELLAKGDAGEKLLQILRDSPRAQFQTTEIQSTNGGPLRAQIQTTGGIGKRIDVTQSINQYCIMCHGPQRQEGNLDLTGWFKFTKEQKDVVRARLVTDNEAERMPRNLNDVKQVGEMPREAIEPFFKE